MPDISLMTVAAADAINLFPIFSNSEIVQFTNFKTFDDINAFKFFLEKFLAIEKGSPLQYGPYSIYLNENIIGLCGLQQIGLAAGKAELWYLLHKDYWGKELAKKAVQLLLANGRQNSQLKTVYAEAVNNNEASWRILESFGFKKTGELKNGFTKGDLIADLSTYALNAGE